MSETPRKTLSIKSKVPSLNIEGDELANSSKSIQRGNKRII